MSILCKPIDFLTLRDPDPEMLNADIHIIEARTKEEIEIILEEAGIQRGSQNWRDYSKTKRLIFKGLCINSGIYSEQSQWICDYLNL